MTQEQKQKILSFIRTCEFGVIATNSTNGAPESAVVGFSETDELEIVVGSFSNTRKNTNITRDPRVSFVIGWDNAGKITVQIEGAAVFLEGEERSVLSKKHCRKNAGSAKYQNDQRQQYFKIIPRWIRYSDFSVQPQEVWEEVISA